MNEATLTFLVIAVIVFVVGRALVLWYFRINEQVALLKEIRDSLAALRAAQAPGSTVVTPTPDPSWWSMLLHPRD